jgi:hypothetical protein
VEISAVGVKVGICVGKEVLVGGGVWVSVGIVVAVEFFPGALVLDMEGAELPGLQALMEIRRVNHPRNKRFMSFSHWNIPLNGMIPAESYKLRNTKALNHFFDLLMTPLQKG